VRRWKLLLQEHVAQRPLRVQGCHILQDVAPRVRQDRTSCGADGGNHATDSGTIDVDSSTFGADSSAFGANSSTLGADSGAFAVNSSIIGADSRVFGAHSSSTFGADSSTVGADNSAFGANSSTLRVERPGAICGCNSSTRGTASGAACVAASRGCHHASSSVDGSSSPGAHGNFNPGTDVNSEHE